jgi:hypothetical protein
MVTTVAWNPNPNTPVILAATEDHVLIIDSGTARGEIAESMQALLALKRGKVKIREGKRSLLRSSARIFLAPSHSQQAPS